MPLTKRADILHHSEKTNSRYLNGLHMKLLKYGLKQVAIEWLNKTACVE